MDEIITAVKEQKKNAEPYRLMLLYKRAKSSAIFLPTDFRVTQKTT